MRRFLATLPLLLLIGCDGGDGDLPSKPLASEYGSGSRFAQILGPAKWLDAKNATSKQCATPSATKEFVTGATIVAIDRYDETGTGAVGNYWLEDTAADPADYSGATLFNVSFSPPDLRLSPGDVVDFLGQYTEFIGPSVGPFGGCVTLPEFEGTVSFRFDANRDVAPKVVDEKELEDYVSARKHLGQLVKVENVKLLENGGDQGGRYTALINNKNGPVLSNELYDAQKEGPPWKLGGTFKSVTGVLTYFYGFHIAPRSPADFEN